MTDYRKRDKLSAIRDKIDSILSELFEKPISTTLITSGEEADIEVNLEGNTEISFSDITFFMALTARFRCEGTLLMDSPATGGYHTLRMIFKNFRSL